MKRSPSRLRTRARLLLASGLFLGTVAAPFALPRLFAEPPAAQQVASIEQLKTDAFSALRQGRFDQTNELIARAATLSGDPQIVRMSQWVQQFESQRQQFSAERREQYDKAVANVMTLVEAGKPEYAIDHAAKAFGLAEDKKAFRNEKWVDDLIRQTAALGKQYEDEHKWLKALLIYSDLASVEPANVEWKDRLKQATRRVRLVAAYTPDDWKVMQEAEAKIREEAEALVRPPTTQPATKPAKEANAEDQEQPENSGFATKWQESLRDITPEMLRDALGDARLYYYRDISDKSLLLGGLSGLRAVATTEGLEKAFPGLADESRRDQFIAAIDLAIAEANGVAREGESALLRSKLEHLADVNEKTIKLPVEVFVSEFADGAFAELDPFSSMIWPNDVPDFLKQTQGEFTGVGIQIQTDVQGDLKVVSPIEDTPAFKLGIRADDIITHIDGRKARGISLNQAVKQITGPPGTKVTLTIKSPDGTIKDYTITRDVIKVPSIKGWEHTPGGGWDYFVDRDNGIGYIRMTSFTRTTGEDFRRALGELKRGGARGFILDLRYNPGGLMAAATGVVDQLVGKGVIVSTLAERETPNPPSEVRANRDIDDLDLPVVVLVNQYSASASEIVSGALKDLGRATIVGERTFGKGSVQMVFPVTNRNAFVKLTTSHYYLPNGKCIHREEYSQEWGVDPDIVIEMTPDQMRAQIDARQQQELLRDAVQAVPAEGEAEQLKDKNPAIEDAVDNAKAVRKGPLETDPQLSAALLVLRLQLAGAELGLPTAAANPPRNVAAEN